MKINLNHLYQFYITAKEGSIKKASKFLHVTEPTISKQIKDLEEFLEVYLFKRINNHLELTSMGTDLLQKADDVFQRVRDMEFLLGQKVPGIVNHLKVGGSPLIYPYLARILDVNLTDARISNMSFRCARVAYLEEKLQQNKVDVVASDSPLSFDEYFCRKIFDSELIVVGGPAYKALVGEFPQSMAGVPFVGLSRRYKTQEDIDHLINDIWNIQLDVPVRVDSFEIGIEMVMSGTGLMIVPPGLVGGQIKNGSLIEVGKLPGINLSIWLNTLKSKMADPIIKLTMEQAFQLSEKNPFSNEF